MSARALPALVDRYELLCELASGGMGTVYIARRAGPEGFQRLLAVKLCHRELAEDPDFVSMFIDEARLAASIHHAHVVSTIDVGLAADTLFLAMEYVEGASLASLMTAAHHAGARLPTPVVLRVVADLLTGLSAAHGAEDVQGRPLGIIHRDVSPQNVLVGADGLSRLLDFGVAKAVERRSVTRAGHTKGKAAYMAPEQLRGDELTQSVDVYAAGVVLWEGLTGERLFAGRGGAREVVAPSARAPELSPALDLLVLRALEVKPEDRFGSALELLHALEGAGPLAHPREVASVLEAYAGRALAERRQRLREALRASGAAATSGAADERPVASEGPALREAPTSSAVSAPARPTAVAPRASAWHVWRAAAAVGLIAVGCGSYLAWRSSSPSLETPRESPSPAVLPAPREPEAARSSLTSSASRPERQDGGLIGATLSSTTVVTPPRDSAPPRESAVPRATAAPRRKYVPSAI